MPKFPPKQTVLCRENCNLARKSEPSLARTSFARLRDLTAEFGLSIKLGELLMLEGNWYVTHSLMRIARRNRCVGIRVQAVSEFCDSKTNRWAFKATVYKSRGCKGFVGFGDADPSNVSP